MKNNDISITTNILFLDLDGVMVTRQCQYMNQNNKWSCCPMDKKAVKLLNYILFETGAEIVLSSDWRFHYRLNEIREIFIWNRVSKTPIGFTPHSKLYTADKLELGRAEEIKMWVDLHKPDKWVAVDDLDMSPYLEKFVRCPRDMEGIKQVGIKEQILSFLK